MLPAIWRMSSDFFISQQDSALAYRAKDIIALLRRETLSFIGLELWPANSPDLNPVDFRIWGLIQERVYQTAIRDNDELKERLIVVWAELTQRVMTKLLHSGGQGWEPAFKRRDITSNTLLKETLLFSYLTLDSHAFHGKLLPNYNWLSFIEDFWKVFWCVFMGRSVVLILNTTL